MRQKHVLTTVFLLEVWASVLALVQYGRGLMTDEAKYLLSIPYPHPPFIRTILGWTSALPYHEFFWRFVFASLLIQSVWFVWDLGTVLPRPRRLALAVSWLLAGAVILESGIIVMAVFSALAGLMFLWWVLHPDPPKQPALIATLWLFALFTAYQSAVFAPLVLAGLLRCHVSKLRTALYFCMPIVLLCLYSLTNPYALSILLHVSGQEMAIPVMSRFLSIGTLWIVAGSGLLSLVGSYGILTSRRIDLSLTFLVVLGFVILTSRWYDAILFTPLFIGGLFLLFCKRRLHPTGFVIGLSLCSAILFFLSWQTMHVPVSRAEIRSLPPSVLAGTLLIDGFFGHEWQYESPIPVRRFSQKLSADAEAEAGIFVCTKSDGCEDDINDDTWSMLVGTPLPTWVRHSGQPL